MDITSKFSSARNPSTPPEVFAQLAEDEVLEVREEIAKNPSTPPEVLAKLAEDKEYTYIREAVASNPSTPPEVLAELAEDDNWVRFAVARNPSTPTEILTCFANDKNNYVRSNVAANPNAPPEILKKLIDDVFYVVVYIAENPSTPGNLLDILAWNNNYPELRTKIASHPNTLIETLIQLTQDENSLIRKTATVHPTYLQHRAEQDGVCEPGEVMPVEWLQEMYLTPKGK